jgi:cysteinyl-tRNA synthetase
MNFYKENMLMMKKKIVTLLFVVSAAMPLMVGCGAVSSVSSKINDAVVTAKVLSNAYNDEYQLSEEDIAQYEQIVDEMVALQAQIKSYAENSYTSQEFWEKFNDELETLYQKDLATNPNAIPTRMADTPDGLEDSTVMSMTFAKELCDESENDVGYIKSMAELFYYSFEEYFVELIEEELGGAKYTIYYRVKEQE